MVMDGKVALVTWAGSGVGAAVAHRLDAAGARVAVLDADSTAVERVGADLWCGMAVRADASDPAQLASGVDAVVDHYGRLDVLVTTAPWTGPCTELSTVDIDDERWHATLGAGLDATFYATRAALRVMRSGVLVAVTAQCTHALHRSVLAGGVDALVQAVAKEAAPLGLRVHAVTTACPPDLAEAAERVHDLVADAPGRP
ncbi:hypothetical protein GCM10022243_18470 [Saccharothrix violaceirubra]|uniref:NAD(P)-dependent dehydrogenase (Short-subunit alcohol dehydrogenase family) n=1 Tax=Saccharothrix violaceirubra TaxID=413306 RepID=A0A7W7T2W8_9PSEU|nr:SDR family oxidoreductase [Saccharothrix violaceirubra]MBB4965246.1 NAD(P)-dependent dehydrogenase (short-subunit alcohol dehydrogenase family) [Saccharothrix violaceirubra]